MCYDSNISGVGVYLFGTEGAGIMFSFNSLEILKIFFMSLEKLFKSLEKLFKSCDKCFEIFIKTEMSWKRFEISALADKC